MKRFHLYYWGAGLEKWIEFFSTDIMDELIEKFQNELGERPYLKFKVSQELEIFIDRE